MGFPLIGGSNRHPAVRVLRGPWATPNCPECMYEWVNATNIVKSEDLKGAMKMPERSSLIYHQFHPSHQRHIKANAFSEEALMIPYLFRSFKISGMYGNMIFDKNRSLITFPPQGCTELNISTAVLVRLL